MKFQDDKNNRWSLMIVMWEKLISSLSKLQSFFLIPIERERVFHWYIIYPN